MENLADLFNINCGDIVSIVGSGGKTSLLFKLAKELKDKFRVLVSTSARIRMPQKNDYDYLYTSVDSFLNDNKFSHNGLTVISKDFNSETNKLIGIDSNDLDKLVPYFDIILLEADGSKELPLKGWKKHEPPVLSKTTKTIGIFPANYVNKKKKIDFIYGLEEFNILTDNCEYINFEAIGKICSSKDGIFKNSKGNLYLFLNKAETQEEIQVSKKLSRYLKDNIVNNPFDFKICFGSLEKEVYYDC